MASDIPEDPGLSEECAHFLSVSYSLAGYAESAMQSVDHFCAQLRFALSDPEDRALWCGANPDAFVQHMKQRVTHNQNFLNKLVMDLGDCPVGPPCGLGVHTPPPGILQVPAGHQVDSGNESKTRSTLRQFVRDWAREGEPERRCSYEPLIRSLEQYVPLRTGKHGYGKGGAPRVLTPGSGLGRLTFEVARRGYFAEGNEFSYHMLLGTAWILNGSGPALSATIFPYVLDLAGRVQMHEVMRPVCIPDVSPGEECERNEDSFGGISMRSGEFAEVYKDQLQEWDAVLTAFFIDTAHNIFAYLRVIAQLIRPGGLWANVGPLLWHYAPSSGGSYDSVSVELSWEELRPAIERYFEIKEVNQQNARYTDSNLAGKKRLYCCLHFVAIRNSVPSQGHSAPVW